jgi:glyoxylase-like metal-dependent hydrolase (beta-lactamase superfamily II)
LDYLFELVKENVYVLAVWDSNWNSYNNCYFIVQEEGITLIDCGKKEHSPYLVQALNQIGKSPEDVSLLLATHGHEDHVQGAAIFKNAKKYVHQNERSIIEYPDPNQFNYQLSDRGVIQEYDYLLIGYHTPGSVVFYHHPSKLIFTGDFLCFFGDPLSEDGLVSEGKELRKAWLEYLQDGGVAKDELNGFLEGLNAINHFDAEVMCTGHGGVLVGDIKQFVSDLLDVGEKYNNNKTQQS